MGLRPPLSARGQSNTLQYRRKPIHFLKRNRLENRSKKNNKTHPLLDLLLSYLYVLINLFIYIYTTNRKPSVSDIDRANASSLLQRYNSFHVYTYTYQSTKPSFFKSRKVVRDDDNRPPRVSNSCMYIQYFPGTCTCTYIKLAMYVCMYVHIYLGYEPEEGVACIALYSKQNERFDFEERN